MSSPGISGTILQVILLRHSGSFKLWLSWSESLWNIMIYVSEPISGAAPRVALIQKTNIEYVRLGEIVSIMCPAQGFPVPAFR